MNDIKNIKQKEIQINNLEDMDVFASEFLGKLIERREIDDAQPVVISLSGDLGVGKTTFSKAVAKGLGIQEVVTSPTFGIQKQYKITNPKFTERFDEFVHIDAYRIENIKETEPLRFVELFQKPKTLIFIEWPEKITEILPKDIIMLSFEFINENTRKILY